MSISALEAILSGDQLHCPCGKVLGQRVGDCWVLKHRGRKWIVREIILVVCDACGRSLRPESANPA